MQVKTFKHVCYALALLGMVGAAVIVEQTAMAQACPNGKACNTAATCPQECNQEVAITSDGSLTYICRKTVNVGDAGKQCGTGTASAPCLDNTPVICGTTKAKTCSRTSIDCSSPLPDVNEARKNGCT